MSNRVEREAEDQYERDNDRSPVTQGFADDSYANVNQSMDPPEMRDQVPIQRDTQEYEDPMQPPESNSDQQLERDENEAINPSNVLKGDRLRHAKPRTGNKYSEGPNEDDLPPEAQ